MTYEEWLAVEEVSYSDMSTSVMNGFIGAYDLADYVESLTDAKGKMLNATRAANGKFSFDPDDVIGAGVIAYLDSLIALDDEYSDALKNFKSSAIGYCKSVTYPNEGGSLLQYNEVNGLYTPLEVEKASSISILVTGCEERCQGRVYGKSSKLDEPQNLGCSRWGKDRFFFDSIPNWYLYDSLEIRIPYKDLTIEVA